MLKKWEPQEVFTPRGKSVNERMYIPRDGLEKSLKKAIKRPMHIVLHGESGSGKTWLYKKVFSDLNVYYQVLNAATVNSCGSINGAVELAISDLEPVKQDGYDEKKSAEGGVPVLKAGVEHVKKFSRSNVDPYLQFVRLIRSKAGKSDAFVVIENLEHIVRSKSLVDELSSLLLYLDDERYAESDVRILLVGTPSNLRDYFSEAGQAPTIINRIQEIPEVAALSESQVRDLAARGLFEILGFNVIGDGNKNFNNDYLLKAVSWFSVNIPQYVHGICLEIALEAQENNNEINFSLYAQAVRSWVQQALVSENTQLESNVNSKETRHGRKNQVIYASAHLGAGEFSISEVEDAVREFFPGSTAGKTLNISAILLDLSTGDHAILRKTPKVGRYRFVSPKLRILVRWMFDLVSEDKIILKKFDDARMF